MIMFFGVTFYAQIEKVETELFSQKVFDLSIIKVFPDSFPKVSVVFQAKNNQGKPLWLLSKDDISITENHKVCKVIELTNISKNRPLNIALILDHSCSMVDDPNQIPDSIDSYQDLYLDNSLPKDYVMPIYYAKKAISEFYSSNETISDSLFFVSFSDKVDPIAPLTNDFYKIQKMLNPIIPGGQTALYDALYISVDSLSKHASKPVIIALTDGYDNQSVNKIDDLINYANEKNVSIYIIGFGNADKKSLEEISRKTNGLFYYTNNSTSISDIYRNIRNQLKSIYQINYISNEFNDSLTNNSLNDNNQRSIQFFFKNDTLTFSSNTNSNYYTLPDEAITYLNEKKELLKDKAEKDRSQQLLIYSAICSVLLMGISVFVVERKKTKSILKLNNVFPNPFIETITIEYQLPINSINATLNVINIEGLLIYQIALPLISLKTEINLLKLENGIYYIQIELENEKSNTLKIVKN